MDAVTKRRTRAGGTDSVERAEVIDLPLTAGKMGGCAQSDLLMGL